MLGRHIPAVAWLAYSIGALPALWLALRRVRAAEWWWLAAALGVSFVADTFALFGHNSLLVSAVYPVSQAAIVGAVFLSRTYAAAFLVLLVLGGLLALVIAPVGRPDVFLHTIAWLGVVSMVAGRPIGRLRIAVLLYFGLGWACWLTYTTDPGWTTYLTYQGSRLLGTLAFCWAAAKPGPILRLEQL
jgi:hypothetical protein